MRRAVLIGVAIGAVLALLAGAAIASSGSAKAGAMVKTRKTGLGVVLVNAQGRTLYLFMKDKHGKSACYGQCATYWPPLMKKGKVSAGTGVKAGLLGTTKRKNGKLQVTYKGHPLYLFKLDKGAGQVTGQRQNFFGGLWYAVSSSGGANKKAPPSNGTTTTSTTTTGTTTNYTTTSRY